MNVKIFSGTPGQVEAQIREFFNMQPKFSQLLYDDLKITQSESVIRGKKIIAITLMSRAIHFQGKEATKNTTSNGGGD